MVVALMAVVVMGAPPQTAPAQQASGAERQLEAAIHREQVLGDVKGAIEQYKTLAQSASRAVAAQALVHLGQCYEKIGETEARSAYERVVREFSDQKDTLATAQARLAVLNNTAPGSSLALRRVWEGPDVDPRGGVSWDGRYLSFNHWNPGNIGLRNLATGEMRDLTKNTNDREHPLYPALFTPDGKQVVYTWVDERAPAEAYSVRMVGTNGSGPRVLFSDKDLTYIELNAWSRDGASIAAIFNRADKTTRKDFSQIVLISVADGSVRVVKTCDVRFPQPRGFSPDDRYIAYDYPSAPDAESRDIFLLAADGSREVPLVQHPANDELLGWTPDGRGILFSSDRSGTPGAWFLRVADGRPEGTPELLKAGIGEIDFPMSFTRSGSYFYGVTVTSTDAYIRTIDAEVPHLLGAPTNIGERFVGTNAMPVFSPDGQSLAYFSSRTTQPAGNRLVIRAINTGEEREVSLTPDLQSFGGPRWSPDGQAILVIGMDLRNAQGLFRIDPRTGAVSALLPSEPGTFTWGQWTPDGTSLVVWRNVFADKSSRLLFRSLATGQEREVYRAPIGTYLLNVAVSPDGGTLGLTLGHGSGSIRSLAVLPAQGGDPLEVLPPGSDDGTPRHMLEWTPDGKYLLYAKAVTATGRTVLELWRVSPRDKQPQKVGILATDVSPGGFPGSLLRIHPDGRTIAFSFSQMKVEVWAMENFLPTAKGNEKR